MNFMNLAFGGALMGTIVACWNQIKAVAWKLISLLVDRVEIYNDPQMTTVVLNYMVENYRHSIIYDKVYRANDEHLKAKNRNAYVSFELFGLKSLVFWNGWFPVIYNFQEVKKEPGSNNNNNSSYGNQQPQPVQSFITFIRGTINIDDLFKRACEEHTKMRWGFEQVNETEQHRFFIKYLPELDANNPSRENNRGVGMAWYHEGRFRLLGHKPEELGWAKDAKMSAIDKLIFPQRVVDLIEEVKLWRNNRQWYLDRSIPWKRGWLLYGPPGTGKTALTRAFAEDLDMPIFVYSLAEMTNKVFMRAWLEMLSSTPCIALIEDIDNVFYGRENISHKLPRNYLSMLKIDTDGDDIMDTTGPNSKNKGGGFGNFDLSFDCFLNMLDGVNRNEGLFTIITTNNLEAVDPALGIPQVNTDGVANFISTRPGRIDKAIELTYMEAPDKLRMVERILGEYPEVRDIMRNYVDNNLDKEETPAQFQERCTQEALRCFWEEDFNRKKNSEELVVRS